jgi:hypothetical protein
MTFPVKIIDLCTFLRVHYIYYMLFFALFRIGDKTGQEGRESGSGGQLRLLQEIELFVGWHPAQAVDQELIGDKERGLYRVIVGERGAPRMAAIDHVFAAKILMNNIVADFVGRGLIALSPAMSAVHLCFRHNSAFPPSALARIVAKLLPKQYKKTCLYLADNQVIFELQMQTRWQIIIQLHNFLLQWQDFIFHVHHVNLAEVAKVAVPFRYHRC